jgi:predicted RNase H-like HicB family nuclease
MNKYLVIFEKTSTGYSAYVPDLPGCIAAGSTIDETEKNIFEAIQFHIEGLKENKLSIPFNKSEAGTLLFRFNIQH